MSLKLYLVTYTIVIGPQIRQWRAVEVIRAEHARIEFACEALGDLANRGDGIKGQIQRGYPLAVVSATVERGSGA